MNKFPIINRAMVSYAQMKLNLTGLTGLPTIPVIDVKSVDYSDKVSTKYFYMTSSFPVAVYSRRMNAEGSIEFGIEAHRTIAGVFAQQGVGGITDVTFDISILYQVTPGAPFIHDTLHGCRFTSNGQKNIVGGKHLSTSCSMLVAWIEWNGAQTVTGTIPA